MAQGSTFTGPLISGDKFNADGNGPANVGLVELTQVGTIAQAGTATVSTPAIVMPANSKITDFLVDTTVVWNSGSADVFSAGITAGGTDYVSGLSVATAGRGAPTYTAAQLAAMNNIGTNTTLYATVTPTGTAATTGTTIVTVRYIQNVTTLGTY